MSDLKLRGQSEPSDTRQFGLPEFALADLMKDASLLSCSTFNFLVRAKLELEFSL